MTEKATEIYKTADTISFCLAYGSMGGRDCSGIYAWKGDTIRRDRKRDYCPGCDVENGCVVQTLAAAARMLKEYAAYLEPVAPIISTEPQYWEGREIGNCGACGTGLRQEDDYCPACGKKVKKGCLIR